MAKRARSPRYPQISLSEAIEKVGEVFRAERNHRVDKEAVAKALGYGGLNGASVSLIGTLKSYGLLNEDKDGVKVTDDAVTLVRAPDDDPEKAQTLRRVAFLPKVFSELREAYGDDPSDLPSEKTLQYRLEKKGFLEKAAVEVIRTYRDNLELVSETDAEYAEAETVDEQPVEAPMTDTVAGQQTPAASNDRAPGGFFFGPTSGSSRQAAASPSTFLYFKPSMTSEARIELIGDVTQEAIETIRELLKIQKASFPKGERPAIEQPAIESPEPE